MLRQDTACCGWGACFLVSGNWPAASAGVLGPTDVVSFLQTLRLCATELRWPCGSPDPFDLREARVSMLPLMARPLLKPRGSGPGTAKCYLQPQEWSPAFKATFWGEMTAVSSYRLPVELSAQACADCCH